MTATETAPASYYDRIGGAPAITEAVERFYRRLLADPELVHYFKDTELATLKRHQVLLFSQVLGGPKAYDGRELAAAHAGMKIPAAHYNMVGAHLVAVLAELSVPDDIIGAVKEVLASVADDIIDPAA